MFSSQAHFYFEQVEQSHSLSKFSSQSLEQDEETELIHDNKDEQNIPFEENQENREKEEKNQNEELETSEIGHYFHSTFCDFPAIQFDTEVNLLFQSLTIQCLNRTQLSKNILFHQWKIDCAL